MAPKGENQNTELLIRLDEKMGEVLRRMGEQDVAINAIRAASNSEHENFDKRIGALENFRWWFLGVGAAAGVVFSLLKDLFTGR